MKYYVKMKYDYVYKKHTDEIQTPTNFQFLIDIQDDCFEITRNNTYLDSLSNVQKEVSTLFQRFDLINYFQNDIWQSLLLTCLENCKKISKEKLLNMLIETKTIESTALTSGPNAIQYSSFSYFGLIKTLSQKRCFDIFHELDILYPVLEDYIGDYSLLKDCVVKNFKSNEWVLKHVNIGSQGLQDTWFVDHHPGPAWVRKPKHKLFIKQFNKVYDGKNVDYDFFIEIPVTYTITNNKETKTIVSLIRVFDLAIFKKHHPAYNLFLNNIRTYKVSHENWKVRSLSLKGTQLWRFYSGNEKRIRIPLAVFGYMYECDTKKPNVEKLRLLDQFCELFMYTMPCTDQPFLRTVQAKLFEVAGSIKSIADVTDIVLRNHDLVKLYDQTIDEGAAMKGVYDADASGVFYAQQPLTPQHTIFRFQNGVYALPHVGFLINSYYAMRKTVDALIESFMLNRHAQINVQSISAESVDNSYY